MGETTDADAFMAEVGRICGVYPELSALGGGILAAITLGITQDSRSFAKIFGIEHALVLREIQNLAEQRFVHIMRRDERTQRCHYDVLAAA